jgi:hypothetical protein
LAQSCFLLLGVICVQKQVMCMLWLEETKFIRHFTIFLTRKIQIFVHNLVWTSCLIINFRKISLCLNVMPCSPVDSYQPFEICCLHLQGRSPRRNWRNSSAIIWTHECSVCTSTYEVLGTGSHLWTRNDGVINSQVGIPIMLSPGCEVHCH